MLPLNPARMRVEGDCLVWTGALATDGYPVIARNGNCNVKGHRWQYRIHKGEIPEGMVVRHTCDNIRCVNPKHLILGTPNDNVQDRVDRGRSFGHVSDEELQTIISMRESGMWMKNIASSLGIKYKRVEYVLNKARKLAGG